MVHNALLCVQCGVGNRCQKLAACTKAYIKKTISKQLNTVKISWAGGDY